MSPYTGVILAILFLELKINATMASVTRDFTVRTVKVPASNLHKQFLKDSNSTFFGVSLVDWLRNCDFPLRNCVMFNCEMSAEL